MSRKLLPGGKAKHHRKQKFNKDHLTRVRPTMAVNNDAKWQNVDYLLWTWKDYAIRWLVVAAMLLLPVALAYVLKFGFTL